MAAPKPCARRPICHRAPLLLWLTKLAGVGVKGVSVICMTSGKESGVACRGEDDAASGGRYVAEPESKTVK